LVSSSDAITPGILFEIQKADLDALDRAEGAGFGLDRMDDFKAQSNSTGEGVTATTYIASPTELQLIPFDWYLDLVVAGADHHELGNAYLEKLGLTKHSIDEDHTRKGRTDALAALAFRGYHDHSALLKIGGVYPSCRASDY
jgi:gamma-glutamylcyclotransferase